jgi:hypothetical protein
VQSSERHAGVKINNAQLRAIENHAFEDVIRDKGGNGSLKTALVKAESQARCDAQSDEWRISATYREERAQFDYVFRETTS